MNGNRLVLDANIVLYLLNGEQTISEFLEGKQGYVSVVTELELIGYPDIEDAELDQIKRFLSTCSIVEIKGGDLKLLFCHLKCVIAKIFQRVNNTIQSAPNKR